MKKISKILVLALMATFTLAGCESKPTENTDTNTVDSNDQAVEADTKETGDNIKDQAEEATEKANSTRAAGTTSNLNQELKEAGADLKQETQEVGQDVKSLTQKAKTKLKEESAKAKATLEAKKGE